MSLYCIQKVATMYATLLRQNGVEAHQEEEGGTSLPHLLWMLEQLIAPSTMSLTKRHRWLGFIQGCMIKDGLLNVQDERRNTRAVFDGA